MTCDTRQMTCDTHGVMNIVSNLQVPSTTVWELYHRSKKLIQVFAYAIFRLQTLINGKICIIALAGNISWNKSHCHNCSLLVNVRVIAKAITDQLRLQNIFLANFVGIWPRFGY